MQVATGTQNGENKAHVAYEPNPPTYGRFRSSVLSTAIGIVMVFNCGVLASMSGLRLLFFFLFWSVCMAAHHVTYLCLPCPRMAVGAAFSLTVFLSLGGNYVVTKLHGRVFDSFSQSRELRAQYPTEVYLEEIGVEDTFLYVLVGLLVTASTALSHCLVFRESPLEWFGLVRRYRSYGLLNILWFFFVFAVLLRLGTIQSGVLVDLDSGDYIQYGWPVPFARHMLGNSRWIVNWLDAVRDVVIVITALVAMRQTFVILARTMRPHLW